MGDLKVVVHRTGREAHFDHPALAAHLIRTQLAADLEALRHVTPPLGPGTPKPVFPNRYRDLSRENADQLARHIHRRGIGT
ncbi:hypothetical protein [Embleya sp. NPDC050493]|uniref:hypothetical protein n=1 Tax=Embleya sp. NPDC050493 TaxID=3363989 RepID=UPI0037932100